MKIDINSSLNGVFMPRASRFAGQGQISHSRIHTNVYYREVNRRLAGARPGTARQVLQGIRRDIMSGKMPY
ncbi:AHH domain-containing protein [Pleionea litopenaei]|uniref:AHH domain-containing protein n=1 Tax=Pleionea litopenaei TaxID=3070815 RepID=UPI0033901CEE